MINLFYSIIFVEIATPSLAEPAQSQNQLGAKKNRYIYIYIKIYKANLSKRSSLCLSSPKNRKKSSFASVCGQTIISRGFSLSLSIHEWMLFLLLPYAPPFHGRNLCWLCLGGFPEAKDFWVAGRETDFWVTATCFLLVWERALSYRARLREENLGHGPCTRHLRGSQLCDLSPEADGEDSPSWWSWYDVSVRLPSASWSEANSDSSWPIGCCTSGPWIALL